MVRIDLNRLLIFFGAIGVVGFTIANADPPREEDYYRLTTFQIPPGAEIEACGFQMMEDGSLAVCTRRGEIYMIANPRADEVNADQFSLFAQGLHEPLSLATRDGWLYATQRPEVTRMRDTDGDGLADVFLTHADGWGISGNYHEYAFGSKLDEKGEMVVTLCLTGSFSSEVPYRGWAMRITEQGETIPMTSGVRSPGGVGTNAAGDLFYTDNQGPWNGACALKPLVAGKFVGHPGGFRWYDHAGTGEVMGPRPEKPNDNSRMVDEADRIGALIPPAVLFPYEKMGKSASGIACDQSNGRFGPFTGQLFVGDQSASTIMRVDLETVGGAYQGACFPFRKGFASGNVGVEMTTAGAMFVGGTNRGWGSVGNQPFAIERLDWTGKVPMEIQTMRLQPEGFELTFTQPVDAQTAGSPESYRLSTYTYAYRSEYGGPEVDHLTPPITSAVVDASGRKVLLSIDGLVRGHVHELHCDGVRNARGEPLLHPEAYYTVNELMPDLIE